MDDEGRRAPSSWRRADRWHFDMPSWARCCGSSVKPGAAGSGS